VLKQSLGVGNQGKEITPTLCCIMQIINQPKDVLPKVRVQIKKYKLTRCRKHEGIKQGFGIFAACFPCALYVTYLSSK
jgi:hypothetical protein